MCHTKLIPYSIVCQFLRVNTNLAGSAYAVKTAARNHWYSIGAIISCPSRSLIFCNWAYPHCIWSSMAIGLNKPFSPISKQKDAAPLSRARKTCANMPSPLFSDRSLKILLTLSGCKYMWAALPHPLVPAAPSFVWGHASTTSLPSKSDSDSTLESKDSKYFYPVPWDPMKVLWW